MNFIRNEDQNNIIDIDDKYHMQFTVYDKDCIPLQCHHEVYLEICNMFEDYMELVDAAYDLLGLVEDQLLPDFNAQDCYPEIKMLRDILLVSRGSRDTLNEEEVLKRGYF